MKQLRVICGLLALLLSQQVYAVNLWCTGIVKKTYVDINAHVFIHGQWNATYTMVCNLNATWKGVSPEVCKTWFAMLQGAYHAQSPTVVNYWNVSYASCADLPAYGAAPGPSYVMNTE